MPKYNIGDIVRIREDANNMEDFSIAYMSKYLGKSFTVESIWEHPYRGPYYMSKTVGTYMWYEYMLEEAFPAVDADIFTETFLGV